MTYQHAMPGWGDVPSYQCSGVPWATSSIVGTAAVGYRFQNVSKFVTVLNTSAPGTFLRIGFTENGTNGVQALSASYILLDGGKDLTMELRIRDIFVRGHTAATSASIVAGLTGIPSQMMPELTGSASGSAMGAWAGIG